MSTVFPWLAWHSHVSDCDQYYVLGREAVQSGRILRDERTASIFRDKGKWSQ
jgi:hypothetical protein